MRVLISEKVDEAGIKLLREEHEVDTYQTLTEEELISLIPQYDALVVRGNTKVSKAVIEAGKRLKVIARAGLEVDHIDIQAATHKGILVINAPQGDSTSSIEYTFGLILALSRKIPQAYCAVKTGNWDRQQFVCSELRNKVLGIIGLGRIGMGVAQRALAFQMKVIAYDPFINEEKAEAAGVRLTEFDEVLRKADYLTLHLPATVDTRNLLGKEAFARMKRGVKLINCARQEIVDQEALIWALQEGIVAEAAIDAWEDEGMDPANPLLAMDQVICTPRLAARTCEAEREVAVNAAKGVLSALRSEPVATALNIPPVSQDVMETIKPYLNLMEKIGKLLVRLAEGRINSIEVKFNGGISMVDTKMLTLAVIKGVLNPILQEDVNFVNAPEIAKARGIVIKEIKSKETVNFVDLVTVTVGTDQGEHKVAGTLFGKTQARIVEIDNFKVDFNPVGWFLLISHQDVPGVAGHIGTILGENGINITGMQIVRAEAEDAFAILVGVRTDIEADVISRIEQLDCIYSVTKIHFALE